MVNYRLVSALVMLVLVFSTTLLFVSNSSKNAKLEDAVMLGGAVNDYLRLVDKNCRADDDDFSDLTRCVDEQISVEQVEVNVELEDFENADVKDNETGILIVKNVGRQSMDSSGFVLKKNHEVLQEGCRIEGSIDPDYTCRFDFSDYCEEGDVMEVTYNGERAYIRNC